MKQLDEMKLPSPIMPIYFPEVKASTSALIDTGASLSVVTKEFIEKIGLKDRIKKYGNYEIRVGDGKTVEVTGQITMRFLLGKLDTTATFAVLETGALDCILGIDFLYKYGLDIRFKKLSSSAPKKSKIFCYDTETLKPGEESVIKGRVNNKFRGKFFIGGDIAQNQTSKCKGIIIARLAVTAQNTHIPIRIINHTDRPVTIDRRFPLGNFRRWDTTTQTSTPIFPSKSKDNRDYTHSNMTLRLNTQMPVDKPYSQRVFTHTRAVAETNSTDSIEIGDNSTTESWRQKYRRLIERYEHVFPTNNSHIGYTSIAPHKIILKDKTEPKQYMPNRLNRTVEQKIDEQLDEMLRQGIIEKAHKTPWASPLMTVRKKGDPNKVRVVIDYRYLNSCVMKESRRAPDLNERIETVRREQPRYFSIIDTQNAFLQCKLDEESKQYTAFIAKNHGTLQFTRIPDGLVNAARVFMDIIESLTKDDREEYILAYLEEILIYSRTQEEHYKHVKNVLEIFSNAGLTINPGRTKIAKKEVEVLGYVMNKDGIKPKESMIKALIEMKKPNTKKAVKRFIDMCKYWEKSIQNFAGLTKSLQDITKKDKVFRWTFEAERSFEILHQKLISKPLLKHFESDKRNILATDASQTAIGACLSQYDDNGDLRPVFYLGRGLTEEEKLYTATQLELLAVVWSVFTLRNYLRFAQFDILSDHMPLKYLTTTKDLKTSQFVHWILELQSYDFTFYYEMGRKNVVPDHLSRQDYTYTRTEADDEMERFSQFKPKKEIRLPAECRGIRREEIDDLEVNIHETCNVTTRAQQKYKVPKPRAKPDHQTRKSERIEKEKTRCFACEAGIKHTHKKNEREEDKEPENTTEDENKKEKIKPKKMTRSNKKKEGEDSRKPRAEKRQTRSQTAERNDAKREENRENIQKKDRKTHNIKEKIQKAKNTKNKQKEKTKKKIKKKKPKKRTTEQDDGEAPEDQRQAADTEITENDEEDALEDLRPAAEIDVTEQDETGEEEREENNPDNAENEIEDEERRDGRDNETNEAEDEERQDDDSNNESDEAEHERRQEINQEEEQDDIDEAEDERRRNNDQDNEEEGRPEDHRENEEHEAEEGGRQDNTRDNNRKARDEPKTQKKRKNNRRRVRMEELKRQYPQTVTKLEDIVFPIDEKTLKELQEKDEYCSGVIKFVRGGALPLSELQARRMTLRECDFLISGDILYHIFTPVGRYDKSAKFQIVAPFTIRQALVELYHDTALGAHRGMSRTFEAIRETFFWPGMSNDIKNYIDSCEGCLIGKKDSHSHIHNPMTKYPKADYPFQVCHIDLVENLRKCAKTGCHRICTIVDRYSKFVIAFPLDKATSEDIAKGVYENLVTKYGGFPEKLISDRGQNLVSKYFKAYFRYFGTKLHHTTSHRPRANGLVERAHRTMISQMRATIKNKENWTELLPSVVFSMNSSVSRATGYSPFELVMGTPARVFPDIIFPKKECLDAVPKTHQEGLSKLIARHEDMKNMMREHYTNYEEQMKIRYDEKSRSREEMRIGDMVWLLIPPKVYGTDETKKLSEIRAGPYQIIDLPTTSTLRLRNLKTGKYIGYHINSDRVKKGGLRQNLKFREAITGELEDLTKEQLEELRLI